MVACPVLFVHLSKKTTNKTFLRNQQVFNLYSFLKKIFMYIFIMLSLLNTYAYATVFKQNGFIIRGVQGETLENVKKRLIELKKFQVLNDIAPEVLQQHIIEAVQPFGYFNAVVHIRNIKNQLDIRIHHGPQTHITLINIRLSGDGAENPELFDVINHPPFHQGSPLLSSPYVAFKKSIINKAELLGYLRGAFTKATVSVDKNASTAEITLHFNTGPLFYFGQVQFDPTYIKPELLHRLVPFHPGTPYSKEAVINFNNTLSDSGYFNSVVVNELTTKNNKIPIAVHLEPTSRYTYSLGLGYGTDTGVRGRAGLHINPVNRDGHQFNILAQGSFIQNALQAQYVIPGQNPLTDQYNLTGNYSNLNYPVGYANALLFSVAQEYKNPHFNRSVSLNALYEIFHYQPLINEKKWVAYPKAVLTWLKRESPIFSPSGYNITLTGLGSQQIFAGSEVNFFQTFLDVKAAYMIDFMRLRLYGHTLQGLTITNNMYTFPLSISQLLGGPDNLRGYSFNSIGPGKIMTYAGFELQKETVKNLYLVSFYDSGDVYKPSFRDIKQDIGLGFMWVSPIGPIKVGLAQPINHQFQRTTPRPQLVVSMGPNL